MCSVRARHAFVEVPGTKTHCADGLPRSKRDGGWNGNPVRAFLLQLETRQERTMPYLFWAVLPFALMDTWWGMCEQHRDTSE